MIEFTVRGVPQAMGSHKAFFRPGMKFPVVTSTNAKGKPWQETIRLVAQQHAPPGGPSIEAVTLSASFFIPRPKSHGRKLLLCTKRPDLDKYLRCLKDALRGVIYRDDAQVIAVSTRKDYSDAPGVIVRIEFDPGQTA